ncbi:PalH/RIM21-domain-containing protein [Myxozyma melibiosi]|uniref:pH-response regulator protein palH/RIM21 n=1 Tax=Myxozyma melibiosi TaxID=54550 RepID=A0ABR1FEQ1_9ASCO
MWRNPTTTTTRAPRCTQYTIPAGVLFLPSSTTQTVPTGAIFAPACETSQSSLLVTSISADELTNPFYSSIIPIAYTVAGTTVLSWVLFLLLVITLQTRPYLQKLATLTVAISLTIALAEITNILKRQYENSYDDAEELRSYIDDGLALKVMRVVSDVFLWLAQVQTLIRLFPRHREKKIIKWLGLVLIVIDTVFWSLKSFLPARDNDDSFRDAIPALAYLFQVILSVLYSAYVVYYSVNKRRFAYHASNLILAVMSLVAVMTPIIFFLLDISRQYISGWGDFVRWVGAAAASVVVWEWVERIEYLESKEQETGVLGRQVFEDEMLETGTSRGARAPRDSRVRNRRRRRRPPPPGGDGADGHDDRRRRVASNDDGANDSDSYNYRRGNGGENGNGETGSSAFGGSRRASLAGSQIAGTSGRRSRNSVLAHGTGSAPASSMRSHSPRILESGVAGDVYDDVDLEAGAGGRRASSEMDEAARKEGGRSLAIRLRSRRRRRHDHAAGGDGSGGQGGEGSRSESFATSVMELIESGRAFFFGGRPSSRATTGTSATSYRVNGGSSINMENNRPGTTPSPANVGFSTSSEEPRVRHIHPLKRGLSRSMYSHAPSPQSFALGGSQSTGPSTGGPSPMPPGTANTPTPSVTFHEDVLRRSPAAVGGNSTLTSVTEGERLWSRQGLRSASSDNESGNNNARPGEGVRGEVSNHNVGYDVGGPSANSEIVMNSRSMLAEIRGNAGEDEPPAFEPLPGFDRGDYWDEKAAAETQEHTTSGAEAAERLAESEAGAGAGPRGARRAVLEPTEHGVRRAVQRLTGARDWVVMDEGEGRDVE